MPTLTTYFITVILLSVLAAIAGGIVGYFTQDKDDRCSFKREGLFAAIFGGVTGFLAVVALFFFHHREKIKTAYQARYQTPKTELIKKA